MAPRPKDKRNRAVKDYPAEKAAFDRLNALDKSIAKYASAWDVFDAIWEASGLLERVEN